MSKFYNLTGLTFGRLTVLERDKSATSGDAKWRCRCSCDGKIVSVNSYNLRKGITKSCGCLQREKTKLVGLANTKFFGADEQRIADVYEGMIKRCYNPRNHNYQNWGGRGITVCDEWLKDKTAFIKWAVSNGYCQGLSIDRIDNDGPYAPWNCRWVNEIIQHNNRSDNRNITVDGITHTIAEWSRLLNLDQFAMYRKTDSDVALMISKKGIPHDN